MIGPLSYSWWFLRDAENPELMVEKLKNWVAPIDDTNTRSSIMFRLIRKLGKSSLYEHHREVAEEMVSYTVNDTETFWHDFNINRQWLQENDA